MNNRTIETQSDVSENRKLFSFSDFCDDRSLYPDQESYQYVSRRHSFHIFNDVRATLYENNPFPGIKTALWIGFDSGAELPLIFKGFKGLWIVESSNSTVMLHGSLKEFSLKNIGGPVIHEVNIFEKNAPWLEPLASCFSREKQDALKSSFGLFTDRFLGNVLYLIELKILTSSIQAFIVELDSEVTNILRMDIPADNQAYNYYMTSDAIKRRNRLQAVTTYPWFGKLLREHRKFRHLVDCGKPLLPEFQEYFNVKQSTIKFCQTFIPLHIPIKQRTVILKSIDSYNKEYHPKSIADKHAFLGLYSGLNDLAQVMRVSHMDIAKPFKNGWNSGLTRLEYQLGRPTELNRIFEMMQASYYYGVQPILKHSDSSSYSLYPPSDWYVTWFSQYGLRRLLQMSYRWEKEFGEFSLNRIDGVNEEKHNKQLSWPALLPSTYSHGSFRIFELTSQAELETEGRKLEHCVASYTVNCLLSGSYIYAVRDRYGNSLSTFEVQFSDGALKLMKHYAMNNDDPPSEEKTCVKLFVQDILIQVGEEKINKIREKRCGIGFGIRSKLIEADSDEDPITSHEEKELQDMVVFTHPKNWGSDAIIRYFESCSQ